MNTKKITIELTENLIKEIEMIKKPEMPIEEYLRNIIKTITVQQIIRKIGQEKFEETKDW